MTKIIMVIRHAEKPDDTHQGIDEAGMHDKESLSVIGWQRAGALAAVLAPHSKSRCEAPLVRPAHLFATKLNPAHGDHSKRPQQTLTPLARVLAKDINTTFGSGEEELLIQEAIQSEGPVLIAWRHVNIPKITSLLLEKHYLASTPWPEDRFDVILHFERKSNTTTWSLVQVPQKLLAHDQDSSIWPI